MDGRRRRHRHQPEPGDAVGRRYPGRPSHRRRRAAQPAVVVDGIQARLDAPALAGPYKIEGTARAGGDTFAIKAATGAADGKGGFALKANVRSASHPVVANFDGPAEDRQPSPDLGGQGDARPPHRQGRQGDPAMVACRRSRRFQPGGARQGAGVPLRRGRAAVHHFRRRDAGSGGGAELRGGAVGPPDRSRSDARRRTGQACVVRRRARRLRCDPCRSAGAERARPHRLRHSRRGGWRQHHLRSQGRYRHRRIRLDHRHAGGDAAGQVVADGQRPARHGADHWLQWRGHARLRSAGNADFLVGAQPAEGRPRSLPSLGQGCRLGGRAGAGRCRRPPRRRQGERFARFHSRRVRSQAAPDAGARCRPAQTVRRSDGGRSRDGAGWRCWRRYRGQGGHRDAARR